jgi:hypothetical protein
MRNNASSDIDDDLISTTGSDAEGASDDNGQACSALDISQLVLAQ